MEEKVGKENKKWTEEERLELAAKLDSELDEYINSLEKKSYTEGWPEDRWQEEMEKHPFFMKEVPKAGEPVSPLMEGLQQLKYSTEDNTPEELAVSYKEDGNYNYKYKNYRLAILSYTEGIKTKCKDNALMAQLYNNRAAANFMLQNYRSSLYDSEHAMKLDPKYSKAHNRAATCCFRIKNYDKCIELCDKYLELYSPSKPISVLKSQAIMERKKEQRNVRMQEVLSKKAEKEEDKVMRIIREKKINVEIPEGKEDFELRDLVPLVPQLAQHRVRLDRAGRLIWPVTILYPETLQTDFIQNFYEDTPFMDQLEDLFEEPPEWDREKRYILPNLNVYFEGPNKSSVHKVDVSRPLSSILEHKKFVLRCGTPSFLILIASSDAEKRFLDAYKRT
ncbi:DNA polymerase interacting tetratricopeptide repeat-containing, protein of 47 kDa isoform X2 [Venturia canescens]|nr:DNA polymerase interacting tetratricopeptide repeat-containing, protein of 47 kDa isoform X2 [Venturia canescens]XP_043289569.1 DNA polymerase interacting tetratricopeptide repeat-containing, protein of 47 kDa isoform X2 [Venturia canescens]XP_043289570.1 DNA polymerase interacting tetratricopeptide repeat-containing, protein of 47 kDa isoform X2 [Venturia canescens]